MLALPRTLTRVAPYFSSRQVQLKLFGKRDFPDILTFPQDSLRISNTAAPLFRGGARSRGAARRKNTPPTPVADCRCSTLRSSGPSPMNSSLPDFLVAGHFRCWLFRSLSCLVANNQPHVTFQIAVCLSCLVASNESVLNSEIQAFQGGR
jgi:hypothetical protein